MVFSIDDNSDFQADFVLATLLGSTSASTESGVQQAQTVSANLPNKHPSTVRERKNSSTRQNKVMQNGRGKRTANEEDPSRYNEDEWNHPFSIPARDLNSVQGRERDVQTTSSTKNSAGNSSTSTNSQSGLHSTTQNGSRHSVSRDPYDGDGEDVMVEGGYVEEGEDLEWSHVHLSQPLTERSPRSPLQVPSITHNYQEWYIYMVITALHTVVRYTCQIA